MKKLTYEMPGFAYLDVVTEQGFAASNENWFQNDMGGGSTQVEVPIVSEDQWG